VTVGVSEALDPALRALINPGDEVRNEPCLCHKMRDDFFAGESRSGVETKAENGFRLTRAMLEAKCTAKMKVLC
jgi:aminotransferase